MCERDPIGALENLAKGAICTAKALAIEGLHPASERAMNKAEALLPTLVAEARALLTSFLEAKAEEQRRKDADACQEIALKHEGEVAKMRSASDEDDYCEDMDAAWNRSRGARECEAALRAVGKGEKR